MYNLDNREMNHLLIKVAIKPSSSNLLKWMASSTFRRAKSTDVISPEKVEEIKKESQLENIEAKESNPMKNTTKETSKKTHLMAEFFDNEENFGVHELRPVNRPGRSWTLEELRLKSNADLHKLWYVLLKERNMLLTMKEAYTIRAKIFPNPERLDRVEESMKNLEAVVHERNDAYLQLETGESASPPLRTVTSFAGFTYQQPAKEHYEPFEVTRQKEYEIPYLDDDAYLTQKLWNEKQHMKKEIEIHDKYMSLKLPKDYFKYKTGLRKQFDRIEHMPEHIVNKDSEQSSSSSS